MTTEMRANDQVPPDLEAAFLSRGPASRLGCSEDIAEVAAMLLSRDARWINGRFGTSTAALMR